MFLFSSRGHSIATSREGAAGDNIAISRVAPVATPSTRAARAPDSDLCEGDGHFRSERASSKRVLNLRRSAEDLPTRNGADDHARQRLYACTWRRLEREINVVTASEHK
jgi:hypothetical protein